MASRWPADVTRIMLGPTVEGTTGWGVPTERGEQMGRGAWMGVGQIEVDGAVSKSYGHDNSVMRMWAE